MSVEIKVPDLGDGVVGKLIEINVKVGDKITKDTIIATINMDKADAEVPADVEGTVEKIVAQLGSDVKQGDVLLVVSNSESAPAENVQKAANNEQSTMKSKQNQANNATEAQIKVPSLGDGVKGSVTEILVKVGDTVSKNTIVAAINLDKADAEMPAEVDGVITSILVSVGQEVGEGDVFATVSSTSSASAPAPKAETPAPTVASAAAPAPATSVNVPSTSNTSSRTSPLARKLARELGIDLANVSASGAFISKLDVINAYAKKQGGGGTSGGGVAQKALPDFAKYGTIRREKMSRIGELTAENLSYAWSTVPHAWILEKVDLTDIEANRQKHKDIVKAKGASLTITAIIAKAVAKALEQFPVFNASCDMANKEIIYKEYIHMGIAVDTPNGLVVPVIMNCDKKSIFEIAQDLGTISADAKKGKLNDLKAATFTISNVGGIGGSGILPIVNTPQAAILGVTGSNIEAVWNGTEFKPRLMMQMTIGFDHRVINGADATRFLQVVKQNLEDPFMMSLY
jgi:pyruvate dehydrogenase E2 component (dihydrolipoamide acetyltransferase)